MKLSLDESKGGPLIEETSTCGRRGSSRLAKSISAQRPYAELPTAQILGTTRPDLPDRATS